MSSDLELMGRFLYNTFQGAGNEAEALELIGDGAYLNIRNSEGITTLMCACAGGHTKAVLAMLATGRDVALEAQDSHGWTALITAAHRADAETLRALLQAGADPTVKDKMGRDALYYAKGSKDAEKISALENGLAVRDIVQGATVLKQPVKVRKPLQYKP
ncbi:MAG: ankyrin repeat domain-containing protein [Alphaproteobacteria bacterium]